MSEVVPALHAAFVTVQVNEFTFAGSPVTTVIGFVLDVIRPDPIHVPVLGTGSIAAIVTWLFEQTVWSAPALVVEKLVKIFTSDVLEQVPFEMVHLKV